MQQMQFQLIRYPEHYPTVAVTNHSNSKKESRTRVLRDNRQFLGADSVNKFGVNCALTRAGLERERSLL